MRQLVTKFIENFPRNFLLQIIPHLILIIFLPSFDIFSNFTLAGGSSYRWTGAIVDVDGFCGRRFSRDDAVRGFGIHEHVNRGHSNPAVTIAHVNSTTAATEQFWSGYNSTAIGTWAWARRAGTADGDSETVDRGQNQGDHGHARSGKGQGQTSCRQCPPSKQ